MTQPPRQMTDAESRLAAIQAVVDQQAEDEGLWFEARTAPEAYLQQELRRLHAVIESDVRERLAERGRR